ncbi:MAG: oligosaccharide flippase family protein [Oscillospiraceae bacterium]|nr:oligosaccharide flippase family protein [Oscillospiraceae bacterium]
MKERNKGIIWSYAYTVVNMICGLFLSSYLLRMLGDTEYGIYQTISSFANCLVMLEFGTGTVLTKNIILCRSRSASKEEIDRNISTIWTITLILSAIIAAVGLALYIGIDNIYANSMTAEQITRAKQIYIVTLVYLLASFMFQTGRSTALGFENYTFSSKINLIRVVLRTGLLTLLIWFARSAIYIALIDACLSISLLLFTLYYCGMKLNVHFSFRYFDPVVFQASIGLCMALFIQSIVNQINTNVDKFLIGVFMDPEMVSLYGVGMYVFSVFSSLTSVPISMFAPQIIGEVGARGINEGLHNKLLQATKLVTLIGGSVFFGFIAVGRPFVEIVYGEKYRTAWLIAVVLMSSAFLNMITGVLVNVLDALNKRMFRSLLILVTTLLNVVLTIWWLPGYGIVGAALATAICTAIGQVVIMGAYYTAKLKIRILDLYWQSFKSIIIHQLIAMAAAFAVSSQICSALAALVIGMCVYMVVFTALYITLSPDGRGQARRVLKRKT